MTARLFPILAVLLLPRGAVAQTCDDINPDVQAATLQAAVLTIGTSYRYDYTIVSPSTDTGCLRYMRLDLSTLVAVPDDQVIAAAGIAPNHKYTYSPSNGAGYTAPGSYSATILPLCRGAVGGGGFSYTCLYNPPGGPPGRGPRVYPGQSMTVGSIVSSWPPGPRSYKLQPDWNMDDPNTTLLPCEGCDLFAKVEVTGTTLGPVAPSELVLYNGGGQKPDDVNLFLAYSNPVEHRTPLRASETSFPLALKYGPTTIASTFHATLNGADVTSTFHPSPGRIEAVTLSLVAGSNTVVLSIDGKTTSGHTATDTDRLVLLVGK